MPLYAGAAETNITPPPGVWMGGYAGRLTGAIGVLDELYARALALDDGKARLVLLTADLIGFPPALVQEVRDGIARAVGTTPHAILLHATHTHNGPHIGTFRAMGEVDGPYNSVLVRKLIGVAVQAFASLQPAHLTYGESAAQIGVNRRVTDAEGRTSIGNNYSGPVAPTVQAVCVNGADGRMFAMLFSHACHPTTLPREERRLSADWPGAAVAALKTRFAQEAAESGFAPNALPLFFQGCCGDINPLRRGDYAAVLHNGQQIAQAAHTARWNAHGRLDDTLTAAEITVELPLLPPPSVQECERLIKTAGQRLSREEAEGSDAGTLRTTQAHLAWANDALALALRPGPSLTQSFTLQRLTLGGVHLLGFPAEMFVQYQLDFASSASASLLTLGHTNGCWNYLPTADEYARGGYEIEGAFLYYGTQMFAPESDALVREAAACLLVAESD